MNCVKIGICNGRGYQYNIELLRRHGIIVQTNGRNLTPSVRLETSESKVLLNQKHLKDCTVTIIPGKARDLTEWLASGFIDMAVGYDMHLKNDQYNFRLLDELTDCKEAEANISLVCKKGDASRLTGTRYVRRIASEFPTKVLKKSKIIFFEDFVITEVSGSCEGLVTNPNLDFEMACTVVQTGKTLEENGMQVFEHLATIRPSIFIRRGRWSRPLNWLLYTQFDLPIYVDGIDGSGKTTLVNSLRKLGFTAHDRSILTKLTLKSQKNWRDTHLDLAIYIVLDCEPTIASSRVERRDGKLDVWAQLHRQHYYSCKFRALAARYGIYLIDTTSFTPEQIVEEVLTNLDDHLMPRIDRLSKHEVEELEIVAEGHSKIVRRLNDKYDLVEYKPTVHSHKKQRAGVVNGTDFARMAMFRNMIEILWVNRIHHTTVYIGDRYLLVEHLDKDDIPNIEIIVKAYLTGTDKHRYYGMEESKVIFDGELRGIKKYAKPYVRFDWRNPNHHPDTGRPLGDEAMSEGLAQYFINVDVTKKTVLAAFEVIGQFLRDYCDIEILDICFMTTKDGSRLYYEISPDCARLYKIHEDDSVDKDVWRAGGSSDLVLEKWKEAGRITEENLINYLKGKDMM